jgi:hypothetical protein
MTTETTEGADRRNLLERRAEVRIARLGRLIDALDRRREIVQKEVRIDIQRIVGGVATLAVLVVGTAFARRWLRSRHRSVRHWLSA